MKRMELVHWRRWHAITIVENVRGWPNARRVASATGYRCASATDVTSVTLLSHHISAPLCTCILEPNLWSCNKKQRNNNNLFIFFFFYYYWKQNLETLCELSLFVYKRFKVSAMSPQNLYSYIMTYLKDSFGQAGLLC